MTATGNDTYDIPLDTQFNMVYAYLPGVTKVEYHENNRGTIDVTLFS